MKRTMVPPIIPNVSVWSLSSVMAVVRDYTVLVAHTVLMSLTRAESSSQR